MRALTLHRIATVMIVGILTTWAQTGQATAGRQICGDQIWEQDPCEFCGQDALYETGWPEMNHDCTLNITDFGYFAQDFGLEGEGIGGDFNGNGICDGADFASFGGFLMTHYGEPVPTCEPCDAMEDSCAGTIRVNFSVDPQEDMDQTDVPPGEFVCANFVVEGCAGLAAALWGYVETSQNLVYVGDYYDFDLPLGGGIGVAQGTLDDGAHQLGGYVFQVMDDNPGWIRLTAPGPGWDFGWTQIPPGRRMGFQLIAGGGVNGDPPADSLGCPEIPPPGCGDYEWTYQPCEFCGQDYMLTGPGLSGDFDRNQVVDLVDFATFVPGYHLPVPDCEPCGEVPDSCAGILRVSFSPDLEDLDRIDIPPYYPTMAYIVGEDCPNLAAANLVVYMTENLVATDVTFPGPLTLHEETTIYQPPFDAGPNQLATVVFYVTDSAPAWIGVRGSGDWGPQALQWVQLPPGRRMGFETIAFGGVNGDPRPDSTGCGFMGIDDSVPGPPLRVSILTAPNPASREVMASFALPRAVTARIFACDPLGRVVRRLHDGFLDAGPQELRWDGRSDLGQRVPTGAYFIRLEGEDMRASSRLIWIR